MKKNMYSLMLLEGLIKAVDAEAQREGTNRSALVNQVLADYFKVVTPENHWLQVTEVFNDQMKKSPHLRLVSSQNPAHFSAVAYLSYPYNPTVHYSICVGAGREAEVRVTSRSKSQPLLRDLDHFFTHWQSLEERALSAPQKTVVQVGRMHSTFPVEILLDKSPEGVGKVFAQYIQLLDDSLGIFLKRAESSSDQEMFQLYRQFIQNGSDYQRREQNE